jgi:hypothetical protein
LPNIQDTINVVSAQRSGRFPRSASDAQGGVDNRARRLALYEAVHAATAQVRL